MTRDSRLDKIRRSLLLGPQSVESLASGLGISPSTVRRDLALLEKAGGVIRTHGGAVIRPEGESSLAERESVAAAAKLAIGRLAAELVAEGSRVLLGAGTTVEAVARMLATTKDLTVFTDSLPVMGILGPRPNIDLYAVGGRFRHLSASFFGPAAEKFVSAITVDHVFVSGDAIDAQRGVSERSAEQASLKAAMMRAGGSVYVVADGSKAGAPSPAGWWTAPPTGWTLVTDTSATDAALEPFRHAGPTQILIAGRRA
ncbi:MAG TPA: DeoR/GlpR family DNA-binding transcription regulator [Microbacteriaceae bacterium]|nr:DeoR/GlpR family DNA-binding transcription regulator [Microbacteriaceae bacterium]